LVCIPQIGGTGARVNQLGQRIVRFIEGQEPLSIAQFMTMALHDPCDGYYATHDPIGAKGDFITAPEISQMFGELLGLWCVQAWRDQGSPSPARLVELGPGRGTLMADALRAARVDPEFLAGMEVVLVETSEKLRRQQASALASAERSACLRWSSQFDDSLTDRPLFLLANEFFDALPIRQFVRTADGWRERVVSLDSTHHFTFTLSSAPSFVDVPAGRGAAEPGAIYEISPAAEAIAEQAASAIAAEGGAALIVDYGYGANASFAETLQAVSHHGFAGVLDAPGEADLSAHVDFCALARAAERAGASTHGPIGQGEFLRNLGIAERAAQLSSGYPQVQGDLDRLTSHSHMGILFKALAIVPKRAPKPPGF
jgi:NADH dehydrogenase [ubiquinone] 1 alpha subcomplex assembly factor 7